MGLMNVKSLLDADARKQATIERRVRKTTTSDLLTWAELAADGVSRHLSSWRRNEEAFDLDEAATGAQVLAAALREIQARQIQARP